MPDPKQPEDVVMELDELWSFVRAKRVKAWIWTALCRKIHQVIIYAIDDINAITCLCLWDRIPEAYHHEISFPDFWESSHAVISEEQHCPRKKGTG
jgi:IS1 family transposase